MRNSTRGSWVASHSTGFAKGIVGQKSGWRDSRGLNQRDCPHESELLSAV